jgi:mannose-1-phosphate guanylyltransferase
MSGQFGHTWALVLAAGEGSRLRTLTTTPSGVAVPKQFCSLRGGLSLLQQTLQRAQAVAAPARICSVVAQQHRQWWRRQLQQLPDGNVIVQPENRGTANGILLPLLHIVERDPQARIVLLPSDHHVSDERALSRALQRAVSELDSCRHEVILLGVQPDQVDPELGYIVPGAGASSMLRSIERFVEKPSATLARELIDDGALWNVFIVAARASALLEVFTARRPDIVAEMNAVVAHDAADPANPVAAAHLYRSLPTLDFSRDIAQGCERALRVLTVPQCGWSDLGTPLRVAQTLGRIGNADQFDVDSMDTFNFAIALNKTFGIDIPETDYRELASLAKAAAYVRAQLNSRKHS